MPFNRLEYLATAARARTRELPADAVHELELPSGAAVKVTLPALDNWLASGRLPQSITTESFHHLLQGKLSGDQISDDHIDALAQFQRDIIEATLVEPRIMPDKADLAEGEIYYRDLAPADAAAIFQWGVRQREVARLGTFRENAGVPDAGANGAGVRAAAERPAGRRGGKRSGSGH